MSRRPLLAIGLVVALAAGLVGGLLVYSQTRAAQAQVLTFLETVLSRELEMPVRIGRFSFSPAANRVEARSVTLLEREGGAPLLAVDRIRVTVDLWTLLRGRVELRSVVIDGPSLSLEDGPDFRERLRRLAARFQRFSRGAAAARVPVTVRNAALRYRHEPMALTLDLERLELALEWRAADRARLLIRSDAVNLALGSRAVREMRIEGELAVTLGSVAATRLKVARGASALSFEGTIWSDGQSPAKELTTAGALDLAELASLLGLPGLWKGMLAVEGALSGAGVLKEFKGTLALAEGALHGLPIRQAEARVSLGRELLDVIGFSARTEGGSISGAGSYAPVLERYRFVSRFDDVSLRPLLLAAGRPERLSGRFTGRFEGGGRGRNLADLVGRGEVNVSTLRLEGHERSAEVLIGWTARDKLLFVDRFTIRRGEGSLSGRGRVALATGAIAFRLSGSVASLEDDLWPRGIPGLGGRLAVRGAVSRRLGDPLFVGQVKGQDLRVGATRFGQVDGRVEVDHRRVAARSLRAVMGQSVALLSGEAWLPVSHPWPGQWRDLTLNVKADLRGRAEDLRPLLPPSWPAVGGPLSLEVSAKGSALALSGGGQLEMGEVRVGPERWDSLRATLLFKGRDLAVPRLTVRRRGVTIQAEGRIDQGGAYSVTVAPVSLDLATLPGLAAGRARGTAAVKAWGNGDLREPRLHGEVSLTDAVLHGLWLGNGTGTFSLDRGQWRWSLQMASGYEARGIAPLGLAGPVTVKVAAVNADLGGFLDGLVSRLRFPLTARADGSATLRGDLSDLSGLSGEIELTAVRGQAAATPFQSRGVLRFTLASGAIRINPMNLVGPDLSVDLRGIVKPGEHSEVELAGHAPFRLIEPWVPPVAAVRGSPEVRVALAGRPGLLAVNGSADLRSVDVKLKELPVWLSVERGAVVFTNNSVQFRVAEGAVAGGRLEARGEAHRQNGHWAHTVEMTLDRAQLEQLYDQWRAKARWVSGALSLKSRVSFEAGSRRSPMETLGGKVAMTVEGGSLSRYPALIRIFGLLTSPAQPTRLPDLTREQMPYRRITGDFVVTNGVMESRNLVLDSEVARMSAVGKVSLLERTLEMDAAVRPFQVLEEGVRKVPLLGRVLPREQSLGVVYFDVRGPLASPQVSLARIKTLGQSVVEILLLLIRAPDRLLLPQSETR